jgi:hypothetical protein
VSKAKTSTQVRGRRRLRSVVRPCRRCHGTGRVWGGWDFWGHRQHPCPACRYEKWITGFVYAPRKRRPNVPVRRGTPSPPAAGSPMTDLPWGCPYCGQRFKYAEEGIVHSDNCKRSPANKEVDRDE